MGFLSRRIRDDRGVVREVYGTGLGVGARTERELIDDDSYGWLRTDVDIRRLNAERTDPARRWKSALLVVAILSGFLLASAYPPLVLLVLPVWMVGMLGRPVLYRRAFPWARARFIRDAMRAERRCASCGYDLRGVAADAADGCTVCPECGAAWRLGESSQPGRHADQGSRPIEQQSSG